MTLTERLNAPLFSENLDGSHVLIVWGTAMDWRLQVYRRAIGLDNGAVLVARTIPATDVTRDRMIELGRTLATAVLS